MIRRQQEEPNDRTVCDKFQSLKYIWRRRTISMNDIRLSIKKGKICDLNKCLYIYIHFSFKCDLRCTLFIHFKDRCKLRGLVDTLDAKITKTMTIGQCNNTKQGTSQGTKSNQSIKCSCLQHKAQQGRPLLNGSFATLLKFPSVTKTYYSKTLILQIEFI